MLDVNIAADWLLKRPSFIKEAEAILDANAKRQLVCYAAAFTIPTLFYIVRKELLLTMTRGQAEAHAFTDIAVCLKTFRISPVTYHELTQALKYPGRDYEDKLQLACAIAQNLDAIVTRDRKFIPGFISVLTPTQLLQQI